MRNRSDRFRAQRNGNDRVIRFKILQMRLEHSEEKIDIVTRLRDFEHTNVYFLGRTDSASRSPSRTGSCRCRDRFIVARIRERDRQCQLFRDEIDRA